MYPQGCRSLPSGEGVHEREDQRGFGRSCGLKASCPRYRPNRLWFRRLGSHISQPAGTRCRTSGEEGPLQDEGRTELQHYVSSDQGEEAPREITEKGNWVCFGPSEAYIENVATGKRTATTALTAWTWSTSMSQVLQGWPRKCEGLKNVPMNAFRRRRSCMYCVQRNGQWDGGRREGCTGMTKSTAIGPVICSSWNNAEQRCGCPGGRPQTDCSHPLRKAAMGRLSMAIAGGSDEVGRTDESAKQVHMTWVEDAAMNEDRQCLQRDVTEVDVSRRGAGRTCLMFIVTRVV